MSSAILTALLVVMCAAIVLMLIVIRYLAVAVRRLGDICGQTATFFKNTEQELLPAIRDTRSAVNEAGETLRQLRDVSDDVSRIVETGKGVWEGARAGIEATKAVKEVGTSAFDYLIALKRGLSVLRGHPAPEQPDNGPIKEVSHGQ